MSPNDDVIVPYHQYVHLREQCDKLTALIRRANTYVVHDEKCAIRDAECTCGLYKLIMDIRRTLE